MSSIFTSSLIFQNSEGFQAEENHQQQEQSYGFQIGENQTENVIKNCDFDFDQKVQFENRMKSNSGSIMPKDNEYSLFNDDSIFANNDAYAADKQQIGGGLATDMMIDDQINDIENTILNMIDDEPSEQQQYTEPTPMNASPLRQDQLSDKYTSPLSKLQAYSPTSTGSNTKEGNLDVMNTSGTASTLNLTNQESNRSAGNNSMFSSQSGQSPESSYYAPAASAKTSDFVTVFSSFFTPNGGPQANGGASAPNQSGQVQAQPANTTSQEKVEDCRKSDKAEKSMFDFPEGGWECSACCNYNFKGRKKCYRCKKPRSEADLRGKPEHMFMEPQAKAALKAVKDKQKRNLKKSRKLQNTQNVYDFNDFNECTLNTMENFPTPPAPANPGREDQAQMVPERPGDWTCQRCQNHNFSFRDTCNKCGLSHYESDMYLTNGQQNEYFDQSYDLQCYDQAYIMQQQAYYNQGSFQMYPQQPAQCQYMQPQQMPQPQFSNSQPCDSFVPPMPMPFQQYVQ